MCRSLRHTGDLPEEDSTIRPDILHDWPNIRSSALGHGGSQSSTGHKMNFAPAASELRAPALITAKASFVRFEIISRSRWAAWDMDGEPVGLREVHCHEVDAASHQVAMKATLRPSDLALR
jgi:hypothetical protein